MNITIPKDAHPALSARLAIWAARQVMHLNDDPRVTAAIEAADLCMENPSPTDTRAAYTYGRAAYGAACRADASSADAWSAAHACAYAAGYAAEAASYATANSYAYAATATANEAVAHAVDAAGHAAGAQAGDARAQLLADLITEYDKLIA